MQTCKLRLNHAVVPCSSRMLYSRRLRGDPVVAGHRPSTITAVDHAERDIAVNFRRSRSWAPTHETIDELDRRKRIQITLRFEDADKDK